MDGVQVESFVYHSTTCLNEANASVHDDDQRKFRAREKSYTQFTEHSKKQHK